MPIADLRSDLDRRWSDLEVDEATAGRIRTTDIPVTVDDGSLLLGVGTEGRRLLVPIQDREFHEDQRSASVRLQRRQLGRADTYAELLCSRPELNVVFTALCADVVTRIEVRGSADPVELVRSTLAEWRALFAGGGRLLTLQRLAGLFGELSVLRELARHSPAAVDTWVGPDQNLHDFVRGVNAIEAKATLADDGRRIHVHGVTQMQAPEGGRLLVAFKRLEARPDTGLSVPELIDEICETCHPPEVLGRARAAGYRVEDAEHYRSITFSVLDDLWFDPEDRFPRLVPASFVGGGPPPAVDEIEYTLDLTGASPLTDDQGLAVHLKAVGVGP